MHEAQKFVGVPQEQLLRLPKDASDEAGIKAMWKRLGAPDAPEGYDFSGVKFADGTDLDQAFVDRARAAAAKLNMPKDTAAAFNGDTLENFMKDFRKHHDQVTTN